MGFWDSLIKRSNTNETLPTPTPTTPLSDALLFGSRYSEKKAMAISSIFRCVDLISDSLAIMPIQVKDKYFKNHSTIIEKHPLYDVFDNKNNLMTRYTFIKRLVQSVLLNGNGFAYIERNGDGSVKSLRFLENSDVTIQYNKKTNVLYYLVPLISPKKIEPINMLHLIKIVMMVLSVYQPFLLQIEL